MTTELREDEELQEQQKAVEVYLSALFSEEKPNSHEKLSDEKSAAEFKGPNSTQLEESLPKVEYVKGLEESSFDELKSGVPTWASKRFACSMIHVAGLNLLIPTQFIRGVRRISQSFNPVTKNTSWIKGRYRKNFEDIVVINTKFLAFGREEFIPPKHRDDKDVYIVAVGNGQWGFSCESIGHGINLSSKEVAWRGKQGKRRWLAGSSADNNAVIIDVRRIELSLIMDGVLV